MRICTNDELKLATVQVSQENEEKKNQIELRLIGTFFKDLNGWKDPVSRILEVKRH